jgi:hypothetical protein
LLLEERPKFVSGVIRANYANACGMRTEATNVARDVRRPTGDCIFALEDHDGNRRLG